MEFMIMLKSNKLQKILNLSIVNDVSDIHLTTDKVAYIRRKNKLQMLDIVIDTNDMQIILADLLSDEQKMHLEKNKVFDYAFEYRQRRFRVNIYAVYGGYAVAMRLIRNSVISLDKFINYAVLQQMVEKSQGLILICGATGTGKSTTLASMIDYMSAQYIKHIITLEEPIEFLFSNEKSLIHQREFGKDFFDFSEAVKMALREDPDILMIGEIRDTATMCAVLNAAETGHLVLGTLHASSVNEAIMRMESFFTAKEISSVRAQIASCLNGIIVQQLLADSSDELICCMEILLANPAVKNIIRQGQSEQLTSQMQLNKQMGMQTMKEAEQILLSKGLIKR